MGRGSGSMEESSELSGPQKLDNHLAYASIGPSSNDF